MSRSEMNMTYFPPQPVRISTPSMVRKCSRGTIISPRRFKQFQPDYHKENQSDDCIRPRPVLPARRCHCADCDQKEKDPIKDGEQTQRFLLILARVCAKRASLPSLPPRSEERRVG